MYSQEGYSPQNQRFPEAVHSPSPTAYSTGSAYSQSMSKTTYHSGVTAPKARSGTPVSKPRTFAQWVTAAREATLEIERNGSPLPYVWCLVEGKNIPEHAIVGGEDRRKPLYIARAFCEGGIHLGKAGPHLRLGAAILYNGREIEVSTYEVLVLAMRPLRYAISGPPPVVEAPAKLQGDHEGLWRLNAIKTVILVDDSISMAGKLWTEAREALAGVADLASKYGTDGIDLFFLNNHRCWMELRDSQQVRQIFDSVVPDGQTPTGEKLKELLDMYIPRLEDQRLAHKPITIVVITDGVPTDDPQEVIIDAARRLDDSQVPVNQLGIQFAQIGDDEDATEALKELDDGLADAHGIRDMVDTTLYDPNDLLFTTGTLTKILLGAINSRLDAIPSGQPQNI